ncbi:9d292cb1-dc2c-478e-9732-1b4dbd51ef8b [Thermothielavioides terrestris]|uniref:Uncharacterized protein n=2 Tax=Thermothielavioides terrestris TaxID=2587410 RepID=G2R6D9_THETT|nr:uncharacterized protein THITE_2095935 [Thermothielavioides terrestris NRRL 8126]AEO67624.1 hypothetical protein THITE_2095935 [Thermothielavioides terrestris NRRL 8126]SPQ25753.1 9d292cb1-dc2c-478e-9732-1b4dbd51ef8b [Thermothielavioides terrestris]
MAQSAQDLSRLPVNGCDLFLLEKWDADSALSPDEQMRQIFARFLELPLPERQVYTQRVAARGVFSAGSLSPAEQDILALARPYNERNRGEVCLLRTYYGAGSDAVFDAVVQTCRAFGGVGPECVFSDAARYNYGEDWRRVFGLMPQLLECHDDYEAECAAEFARAQESDEEDEELGGWSRDDFTLAELFNHYHLASKVGVIYILDEETLGDDREDDDDEKDGSAGSYSQRELLVVWYDAQGKTVRWRRRDAVSISQEMAVINTAAIDDHPVRTEAEIGEDYDWDGPLGLSSMEEDEESASDADP